MTYSFEKNTVYHQAGGAAKTVLASFKDPVLKLVVLPGKLCVVTEPDARAVRAVNLFMLDLQGQPVWSAAASFAAGDKNVFVDARVDPEAPEHLQAWDWDGNRYVFSAATGDQLSRTFLK